MWSLESKHLVSESVRKKYVSQIFGILKILKLLFTVVWCPWESFLRPLVLGALEVSLKFIDIHGPSGEVQILRPTWVVAVWALAGSLTGIYQYQIRAKRQ